MTRAFRIFVLAILFVGSAFPVRADFDPAAWTMYCAVADKSGGLVRLVLDDLVFAGAKPDLSDLRIIDQAGAETPYVIAQTRRAPSIEAVALKQLNNSFVTGRLSTVTLDLTSRTEPVNRLHIITPTENFQRNVRVYGSSDRTNWLTLVERAYIYDYTDRQGGVKVGSTDISLPDSDYPYLKIEIDDPESKPVRINRVEAMKYTPASGAKELERKPAFERSEASEKKTTELIADLGATGIPTSKLALRAADQNFHRAVAIYGSNDRTAWSFITNGYIFRYDTDKFRGENLAIEYPETHFRYLKAAIINQDDVPLEGLSLSVFSAYRELLFEARSGSSYRLFYGNGKAAYPQYDLKSYVEYLDVDSAAEADCSGHGANPAYVAPAAPVVPFTERYKWFLPGALAAACLMLFGVVYRFLKTGAK